MIKRILFVLSITHYFKYTPANTHIKTQLLFFLFFTNKVKSLDFILDFEKNIHAYFYNRKHIFNDNKSLKNLINLVFHLVIKKPKKKISLKCFLKTENEKGAIFQNETFTALLKNLSAFSE